MIEKILDLSDCFDSSMDHRSGEVDYLYYRSKHSYVYNYDGEVLSNTTDSILENSYTPNIGDVLYIGAGANVPRVKLKNLLLDNASKTTNKFKDATHIFVDPSLSKLKDYEWKYHATKEQVVTFVTQAEVHNHIELEERDELLELLEPYKDEDNIIVSPYISRMINDRPIGLYKNVPASKNVHTYRSYNYYFIKGHCVELYEYILNNLDKIYDYKELLPHINGEETITMDENVYKQVNNMFNSDDTDNHVLAMEIMANCNYKESMMYLLLLLNDWHYAIDKNSTKRHVNFKSFLGYFNMTPSNFYLDNDSIINMLLDRKVLTVDMLDYILNKYKDQFIYHNDHFRVQNITLSSEIAEALNIDYVREITPRYKVKEVEIKDEIETEVSDEFRWIE
jgi:hypothetical protein